MTQIKHEDRAVPDWVPVCLSDELSQYHLVLSDHPDAPFARSLYSYPDAEFALLKRLTSDPAMENVWGSLRKQCQDKSVKFEDFCRSLWSYLCRANAIVTETTLTKSQRQSDLSDTAKHLRKAASSLIRSKEGRYINKTIIKETTARELTRWSPSTDHPESDLMLAQAQLQTDMNGASCFDETQWALPPLMRSAESRLADSLMAATDLHLDDVMVAAAVWLDHLSLELNPEVKHVGKPIPVFIRKVNQLFIHYFNQPLDETVAQIVSVALDLEKPLNRNDVRPYLTGNKAV